MSADGDGFEKTVMFHIIPFYLSFTSGGKPVWIEAFHTKEKTK